MDGSEYTAMDAYADLDKMAGMFVGHVALTIEDSNKLQECLEFAKSMMCDIDAYEVAMMRYASGYDRPAEIYGENPEDFEH